MILNKNNYKVIRDPIHGDIKIPMKFISIIDAVEFQRLHRINQLGIAQCIFPSAVHTRFSHSIGVYYVMSKLLDHFDELFNSLGLRITKEQKDIALCAGLLHDIGHGPFSHAFELAFGKSLNKSHEDWSLEIILSKESEINKALRKSFGKDFPQKICDLISYNFNPTSNKEENSIFKVLALLVSSQMDADRMDYLLRDAFFTGTTHGKFDLHRLIRSLSIDLLNDEYCICVDKKSITIIEEYLLARYFMYKEVYLNPLKQQMEHILQKVFVRVKELHLSGKDVFIPSFMEEILTTNNLSLKKYLSLDDVSITFYLKEWYQNDDFVLRTLCDSILNRKKFTKYDFPEKIDINEFKNDFTNTLSNNFGLQNLSLDNSYFWIEYSEKVELYKNTKETLKNIIVRKQNGVLENLNDEAYIINNYNISDNARSFIFINEDIFNYQYKDIHLEELLKAKLNNHWSNTIEVENKFIINDVNHLSSIENHFLAQKDFKIIDNKCYKQSDYYFDTSNKLLLNNNKILRIREKENEKFLTIKLPLEKDSCNKNQRFEYEDNVNSIDILKYLDIILYYLPEFKNLHPEDDIKKQLIVETERKLFILKRKDVSIAVCLDSAKYKNVDGEVFHRDYEIELKLLSHYSHRIVLNQLGKDLIEQFGLRESYASKYKRGLSTL